MVGRALECEVERDLEVVAGSGGDEALEVREGAELRCDRGVAALLCADRPGAARVAGRRVERVVLALAVRHADRVDRREVEDVEAESGEVRQDALDAGEAAEGARE